MSSNKTEKEQDESEDDDPPKPCTDLSNADISDVK